MRKKKKVKKIQCLNSVECLRLLKCKLWLTPRDFKLNCRRFSISLHNRDEGDNERRKIDDAVTIEESPLALSSALPRKASKTHKSLNFLLDSSTAAALLRKSVIANVWSVQSGVIRLMEEFTTLLCATWERDVIGDEKVEMRAKGWRRWWWWCDSDFINFVIIIFWETTTWFITLARSDPSTVTAFVTRAPHRFVSNDCANCFKSNYTSVVWHSVGALPFFQGNKH